MTSVSPIDTDAGWMSPTTSPATAADSAYGTLTISWRGVISASLPTLMPRYTGAPLAKAATSIGVVAPRVSAK
jgi:hypothetical protein